MKIDPETLLADLLEHAEQLRPRVAQLVEELQRVDAAVAALQAPAEPPASPSGGRGEIRERVLQAVVDSPGARLSEITRAAGVAPMTASSHLRALQEAGVVDVDNKRWTVRPS
ncbi:MAG: winged helix-turn-helix domain-containing protein [Patulibacter sp.]|nr:winged helix-turn-helix domain-containing protein [Patulibacter sp.]